jgi:hypothetical protein
MRAPNLLLLSALLGCQTPPTLEEDTDVVISETDPTTIPLTVALPALFTDFEDGCDRLSQLVIAVEDGIVEKAIDLDGEADKAKLGWLSKLDAGTLKLKVAASIVAISSIHLLRAFMDAKQIENDKLMWYVIIHLTFVVSAVMLGLLDRMTAGSHAKH